MGQANIFGTSSSGTAFLYGVGGLVALCAVQSFTNKTEPKNKAQVEEENGNVIERRKDDRTDEAQIEVKYRSSYSLPVPGQATIVYEGSTWEVDSIDRKESNKAHRMLTLSISKSQYVDSATNTTVTTTADPT